MSIPSSQIESPDAIESWLKSNRNWDLQITGVPRMRVGRTLWVRNS